MLWPEADLTRAPVGDFPPPWASAWGDDEYGLWAEFTVGEVVQRMRWIEPGEVWMGSTPEERRAITHSAVRDRAHKYESEPTRVLIPEGLWLADTPCTQALWMAVGDGNNPSEFKTGAEAPERPVEQVSWDDVQPWLQALASRLELGEERQAALPTEVQWEYACRAGTRTAYHWGHEPDTALANFGGVHAATMAVKTYAPNAWGLHDMHGNVWEWCADAWRERWEATAEPDLRAGGAAPRVMRGGSWGYDPGGARSAYRNRFRPDARWSYRGFRLALRSPSPARRGAPSR
jgi:formylglycine-generating enzyme